MNQENETLIQLHPLCWLFQKARPLYNYKNILSSFLEQSLWRVKPNLGGWSRLSVEVNSVSFRFWRQPVFGYTLSLKRNFAMSFSAWPPPSSTPGGTQRPWGLKRKAQKCSTSLHWHVWLSRRLTVVHRRSLISSDISGSNCWHCPRYPDPYGSVNGHSGLKTWFSGFPVKVNLVSLRFKGSFPIPRSDLFFHS